MNRYHMRTLGLPILLLCAFFVGSCAHARTVKTKVYEDRRTDVVLRRVVGGDRIPFARGHSHPATFTVEDLKYLLGEIAYREKGLFGWSEIRSVFAADELYRLGPPLVEAFAKATPGDGQRDAGTCLSLPEPVFFRLVVALVGSSR